MRKNRNDLIHFEKFDLKTEHRHKPPAVRVEKTS